jgi:CelD/BcsL family acetyltransferase involved in cellulose biosynthesis
MLEQGNPRLAPDPTRPAAPPRLELARSAEELEPLRAEWDALLDRAAALPFMSVDWMLAAVRHESSPHRWCVCTLRDGAGLSAVLPLAVRHEGSLLRRLRIPGQGWAPSVSGLLRGAAEGEALWRVCLERVQACLPPWDMCHISKIPQGSTLLCGARQYAASAPRGRMSLRAMGAGVLVHPRAPLSAYLAGVSHAHRKKVRWFLNRLRRHFRVELVGVGHESNPEEGCLEAALTDALHVCARSWQARAPAGRSISRADTAPFFREASRALARRGELDLSLLYLDGRPVSYIWAAVRRGVVSLIKTGFDRDLTGFSPGSAHFALYVEDCARRGVREIDHGHEFSEYKLRWGKERRTLYEASYYARPLWGRARRWLGERLRGAALRWT